MDTTCNALDTYPCNEQPDGLVWPTVVRRWNAWRERARQRRLERETRHVLEGLSDEILRDIGQAERTPPYRTLELLDLERGRWS